MIKAIANRLWFPVLLISLQLGMAQPTGQAAFTFTTNDLPVWDLSGPYILDTPMEGAGKTPVPLSYAVYINHTARGLLTGEGTVMVQIGQDTVAGFYQVHGSVSGGGTGVTKASFSVTVRGRDVISGAVRNFVISSSYRMTVDPVTRSLMGRVRGSAHLSHLGVPPIRDDEAVLPLPAGADGSWYFAVNFLPLKSFSGTATIGVSSFVPTDNPPGFPTERVMQARTHGSYNMSKGVTSADVTGTYEGRGSSLHVKFSDANEVLSLRGKVLGQSLKF